MNYLLINLVMNNNVSYKIISANQKIENDKERIKLKFNFNISRTSTNSSALKQSNIPTQKNSLIVMNKIFKIKDNSFQNYENKIIKNSGQKQSKNTSRNKCKDKNKIVNLSQTNINKNEKFYINTKGSLTSNKKKKNNIPYKVNNSNINKLLFDKNNNENYNNITDNSNKIQENQNNLFGNSIMLTQPIIEDDNNYNNKKENKNTNLDKNDEQISIEKEISESFKKSSFSCSSKTSEMHNDMLNIKGGSSENEGNIEIVNNENYIIKNYNGINNKNLEQIEKENEEEKQVSYKPFMNDNSERKMTEVNTMGLLDDDEYNQENRKKMLNNINKYIFIEDIIEKNNKFESLSFDKFHKISNKAKYKIISFCYDNYKNIMNSSIYMRNSILEAFEDRFGSCINDFSNKYKNILLLDNYKFNSH